MVYLFFVLALGQKNKMLPLPEKKVRGGFFIYFSQNPKKCMILTNNFHDLRGRQAKQRGRHV